MNFAKKVKDHEVLNKIFKKATTTRQVYQHSSLFRRGINFEEKKDRTPGRLLRPGRDPVTL